MLQQTASRQLSIFLYESVSAAPDRVGDEARFACFAGARMWGGLFRRPVFASGLDPAEAGNVVRRSLPPTRKVAMGSKGNVQPVPTRTPREASAASFVADPERSLLRRTGRKMLSCREAVRCSIGQRSEHSPYPPLLRLASS